MGFKDYGDAKRYLFEDLCVYFSLICLSLLWDFIVNLLTASGLNLFPTETKHAINIGTIQWTVFVFSFGQFLRKFNDWRYWK